MYDIMLALHVLFAIFTIGPLAHAATTASRGIRTGDAAATGASARVLRMYTYGSVLVVIVGMGLMSVEVGGEPIADFSELWIWLSTVLWLGAAGLAVGVLVPTLEKATKLIGEEKSVVSLTAPLAAGGGVIAVVLAAIVFLMVYQPGR